MPTNNIVIASILKPVDDTRMYEKIGVSIGQTNKYAINIIGFSTKNAADPTPIRWIPLFNFKRNTLKRWFSPWKFFKTIIKVKPQLTIVNTPELLLVMMLNKILFGGKIVYDVIENYRFNIKYTNTYPKWIRPFLIGLTGVIEWASQWWVDYYLLAEKSYEQELSFVKNKYLIVENKFKAIGTPSSNKPNNQSPTRLIYSGTIAEHYGIFEAIKLATDLNKANQPVHLTIIGFASNGEIMPKIREKVANKPFIEIIGGDVLVPHQELIDAISKADVGLLPYHPNRSTFRCIPTKMYEYMAHQLPIFMQQNELWSDLCDPYHASISLDFANYDAIKIWEEFKSSSFYDTEQPLDIYWESEEKKLLTVIETLL